MIQVKKLTKQFGPQILFEDVSFIINPGERIGLVGRNGSGKSTIFRLISGELSADGGEISIPQNYKIGVLDQHLKFICPSILEECAQALPEDQKYDVYRAEKILFGLGFNQDDLNKPPQSFSGGQQIRIQLAKVLLTNPNLLLLDEPTNYLDIVTLRWLKRFLSQFPGELMLITHDRSFMDDVVTHTMGLSNKKLKKIAGKTANYYEQISSEAENLEKTRVNLERKRQHLQDFVDRFGAKASKAKQAQSRMRQIEKMDFIPEAEAEANMGLQFRYKDCPGKVLLETKDLSFSYRPDSDLLFKDLSFMIGRHDRIAIIGKNGKGKSTLLNILAEELKPVSGQIKQHPSCLKGHYGQTNVLRLHLENTIIQEVSQTNPDLSHTEVRQICGAMMFEGELADKKIKVLSGGERGRVLLGKILAKPTNLLLLDEPTNHLDMETVEILKEELKEFPGAVVFVTHNEELLKEVADKLIVFRKSGAEYFYGGYEDFLNKIGWDEESDSNVNAAPAKQEKLSYNEAKQRRSQIVAERAKLCGPLKKRMDALEHDIHEKEELIKAKQIELEQATLKNEDRRLLEISQTIGVLQSQVDEMFDDLSVVAEEHDDLFAKFEAELSVLKT